MRINSLVPVRSGGLDDTFSSLQSAVNTLFDDFTRRGELAPWQSEQGAAFMPRMDVAEDEKTVHVTAELPGLEEKDIDLSLTGRTLTLQGEKRTEHEETKKSHHRVECSYGAFRRSVTLPCDVERDKVQATFKKGVLSVTLPRSPEAQQQSRKIAVKAV